MTFGRVVFILIALLLLWHFRDSLPIDRSSGVGVVAGHGTSPKEIRGTFVLADDAGKPHISLRFIDDTHFQISNDGKPYGASLGYNLFDDKLYLNFKQHESWTLEVRGQSLYRADLRQTFKFVGP